MKLLKVIKNLFTILEKGKSKNLMKLEKEGYYYYYYKIIS